MKLDVIPQYELTEPIHLCSRAAKWGVGNQTLQIEIDTIAQSCKSESQKKIGVQIPKNGLFCPVISSFRDTI